MKHSFDDASDKSPAATDAVPQDLGTIDQLKIKRLAPEDARVGAEFGQANDEYLAQFVNAIRQSLLSSLPQTVDDMASIMTRALFSLTLCSALAAVPCFAAEKLAVVGTGDGIEVLKALGTAFSSEHPDIAIDVPPSIHSAGGIREVSQGNAILGRIARPLKDNELALGLSVVPIFRQPTVFFVHPSAKVRNLSTAQLSEIFSGTVANWREVGGADLRVRVVRREEVDSSLAMLRDTLPGWKGLKFNPSRSKLAVTTQDAFNSVEENEGAIGFGPYSRDLDQRFTVLRIDGVHPTEPAYPSAVTLSLIYRDATVTTAARKFIDFIFTEKAQHVVRDLGATPIVSKPELI